MSDNVTPLSIDGPHEKPPTSHLENEIQPMFVFTFVQSIFHSMADWFILLTALTLTSIKLLSPCLPVTHILHPFPFPPPTKSVFNHHLLGSHFLKLIKKKYKTEKKHCIFETYV